MKDQYSIFSLRALEAERDRVEASLSKLIELNGRITEKLDSSAFYLELIRHEISIRNMNRKQWNGAPVRMEIVD
jgi:hypothetical protein